MKILVATGIYPPNIGGPATYAKLLNDELPKRGISVTVVSFYPFLKYPKFISQGLYFCELFIKGIGHDIIYALDPVSVGFPAMILSKILRKKFIVKIVGDRAWEQGVQEFEVTDTLDDFVKDRIEYHPKVMRIKMIQKKVAKFADIIIVPSRYLKKIISNWGIDEDKISVIYNAFNVPENIEATSLSENSPNSSGINIISIGRLLPWKGFEKLILVMSKVIKEFPDARLLIIGDGPDMQKLEREIYRLKLEGKVILAGALSKEEVIQNLKASDLFVLNTNYEGLSHVLLEAQATKIPIVTTSVGGNLEVIEDGENGFLVDFNDIRGLQEKITTLLHDKDLREKFTEKGFEKVSSFTEEKMLDQLTEEFERTI